METLDHMDILSPHEHPIETKAPHMTRFWVALTLVTLLLIGVSVYAYLRITALDARVAAISDDLSSTTVALYGTTGKLALNLDELSTQTHGISQTLNTTKQDVASAADSLSAVKTEVGGVQQTIGSISGTVTTLQKLSTIDPELLKKYSKVYFLNENYTPVHLSVLQQQYVYSNVDKESFSTEAEPFLKKLLDSAKADGVTFYVDSAYRSFSTQQSLKSAYSVIYGAGTANTFSADQGYSEHQLGTAVDFINPGTGGQLTEEFGKTPSFKWLTEHAYMYGFEISYPEKNAYYVYEPWHWRFVGIELATYLHDNNLNFYAMDQRDIDAYLANLFDWPF